MKSFSYIIEPELSSSHQALVIRLEKQEHKEIIQFLQTLPKGNWDGNLAIIPYNKTVEALKLFATCGKICFQGRSLVVDLWGKSEFYYKIEVFPDGRKSITGHIKSSQEDFEIQKCDFICSGSSNWYVKGISLKLIDTEVSWKELKASYTNSSEFSFEQIQERLDSPADPTAPRLVFLGNALEMLKVQNDPLPILMLKDRTGAFADLYMDYGQSRMAFHTSAQTSKLKRNTHAEKLWEKDLLETDFISKKMANSNYYCPLDKVSKSIAFLLELGWRVYDHQGKRVVNMENFNLAICSKEQAIHINGKVKYAEFETNLSSIVGAFNRRERFLQLSTDTVGLIPPNVGNVDLEVLATEGEIIQEGIKLKKNHLGCFSELLNASCHLDEFTLQLNEKIKDFKKIEMALPDTAFQGTLRPYQQEGLNWLQFLYDYGFHGILADDMGLGKTIQVLALISRLKLESPILIIVPTSLIFNWKQEFENFLPHIPIYEHHGLERIKNSRDLEAKRIIVTSYTTLRIDLALFAPLNYQAVILDEAQAIKNSQTQIATAIFALRSRFRLSITGTPIENHLGDLYSQFRFLMPDLLGDEKEFTSEIQAAASDSRYLNRIKRKIRPFILRRKKEDVLKDLPERTDQIVWTEMNESQRQIYESFLAGFKTNLFKKIELDGWNKHRMEILEAILRLRQICCHPLLVSSLYSTEAPLESTKFDLIMEDLALAIEEGRKILIYSQFTSMLKLFVKAISEKGWRHLYLDGSTQNREQIVTQFQQDGSISLFLISLKAGGTGLNLTAADYVFLVDPWWNEAVEEQAISRAHRIGRKNSVFAKRYLTIGTIEEKMLKIKERKKALSYDLLEEGNFDHANLNEEDIRYLLS